MRSLSQIDAVTPWAALVSALAPHYLKREQRGRRSIGLERMLRMFAGFRVLWLPDLGSNQGLAD